MFKIEDVDGPGLARLLAVRDAVHADDPVAVEELLDWRRQAGAMRLVVAVLDGRDAGAGVAVVGWHSRPQTAHIETWTVPAARGRGVGGAVLAELVRWSAGQGSTAVEMPVAEDDESSLAWAARRSFVEVGRDSRLVLDLDAVEAPAIDPPPGIEIVSWADRPGLDEGLYQVFVEAAPDIPGEEDAEVPSLETWLDNDMRGSGDRPEAVFVALEGGEVAGFAKLSLPTRFDGRAFHDLTGVRRASRGRGIAAALKRAQIRWAKEQGYRRLITSNEQRNEPIRRLNTRYGYRVEPGRILMRAAIGSVEAPKVP